MPAYFGAHELLGVTVCFVLFTCFAMVAHKQIDEETNENTYKSAPRDAFTLARLVNDMSLDVNSSNSWPQSADFCQT